ncbi:hypothetical protein ABE493_01105 [Stenotrophomonas terrae]|uniref:hypothetical protein n=1 Tax=Stenotrophomonas terrae TaxID=405446 RepID=UPI003209B0A1
MYRVVLIAAAMAAANAAAAAESVPPSLAPSEMNPMVRNLCLSQDMVAELVKQDPAFAYLGGSKRSLATMQLVLQSADQNLRKGLDEMLASAIGGDVKSRETLSPALTSCLVAGVRMAPERRQLALTWLQEDSIAGKSTATEQLMTLTLLKEVEGGGSAAATYFQQLPGKTLDTTSPDSVGIGLFAMQDIAANSIINAAIQSYYTRSPQQLAGVPQPAVTYRFCNNSVAAAAGQTRGVHRVAAFANARVQQLPEPVWNCDMAAIKEEVRTIRWGTDAPSSPAPK